MITIKQTQTKLSFAKGIRIRQIAKLLGVTRQTVYNWKMGKSMPTPKNMEKIRKAFK